MMFLEEKKRQTSDESQAGYRMTRYRKGWSPEAPHIIFSACDCHSNLAEVSPNVPFRFRVVFLQVLQPRIHQGPTHQTLQILPDSSHDMRSTLTTGVALELQTK
jgi:hypothetical protein